jgi:hypothetical protein
MTLITNFETDILSKRHINIILNRDHGRLVSSKVFREIILEVQLVEIIS